ncbi:hypothetical protein D3C72_2450200 [compost metagenome]
MRVQAVLAEVVAIERDVQSAHGAGVAHGFLQGLGNPDAAGADADVARFGNCPAGQVGAKVDGHLPNQFGWIG